MSFKASTNDVHPGSREEIPSRTQWANGPNAGKTLAEAPRPVDKLVIDQQAAEQARIDRRWNELHDVGRMQVRSRRLGIEKSVIDGQIELAEMEKDYPYEFVRPDTGRPPWFYPMVVGVCLLQLTLLLVLVAHQTRPTLSKEVEKQEVQAPKVASAQGRGEAQKGGRR
jgi:hypothetical protein